MARLAPAVMVCGVTVAAISAVAQTRADPRSGVVASEDDEPRSHLWESALDPQRAPYDQLVAQARRRMRRPTKQAAQLAVEALDDAIARMPRDGRAYALRGQAHLVLETWRQCAEDLEKAVSASEPGPLERDQRSIDLGICQGRAGRLLEAEQTLLQATTRASRSEPWLRLGEVRIGLGKLDAAIDALEIALEKPDAFRPFIEWLLAIAHDRGGRSSEARRHASRALAYDSTFDSLVSPRFPWLRVGDRNYALALAHRASRAPEYALAHYRRFLVVAPQSPWRRRVQQHIRELRALELPQMLQRDPASSATVDLAAIRPLIRNAMPALRACVAKQTAPLFAVAVTRNGPRTPQSARNRLRSVMPTLGSRATAVSEVEGPLSDNRTDTTDAPCDATACRCLEQIADRIALPLPRKRDTWYRIRFVVVPP